jgi:site-specific recombinase XerD
MNTNENAIKVGDAVQSAMLQLVEQKYHAGTIEKHKYIYRALELFTEINCAGIYSESAGEEFMKATALRDPPLSQEHFCAYNLAIQRINNIFSGNKEWRPCSKQPKEYAHSCFDEIVKDYEVYLESSGKTIPDIRARLHKVAHFLSSVESQGVKSLSDLNSQCIYKAFERATDKGNFHNAVYSFLRYAFIYSIIKLDFSKIVPSIRRHTPIPSIYSPEEVEMLLASIDRNTSAGKRNFAMILIIARIGLRSCDVCNLSFKNINRGKGTIEIIQLKTGENLVLPLLPEIDNALDDYIKNARPKHDSEKIFLQIPHPYTGPLQPRNLCSVVFHLFDKASIDIKNRWRGPRALRASLATALLDEGNDYATIQQALGHKNTRSIKSYVKVDIEHLRPYSLTVPPPSAAFDKYLTGMEAGL